METSETKVTKTAKQVEKFVACQVEIIPTENPPFWLWRHLKYSQEEMDKREKGWYEDWAKTFKEFLRDHRSQDVQGVTVNVQTQNVCSECGHEWETMIDEDTKAPCCAWCGVEIAR